MDFCTPDFPRSSPLFLGLRIGYKMEVELKEQARHASPPRTTKPRLFKERKRRFGYIGHILHRYHRCLLELRFSSRPSA